MKTMPALAQGAVRLAAVLLPAVLVSFGLVGKLGVPAAIADSPNPNEDSSSDAKELIRHAAEHYQQGDLDKAVAEFTSALRIDPKNSEALRGRARAYCDKDDLKKALADANEALGLDAKDGECWRFAAKSA